MITDQMIGDESDWDRSSSYSHSSTDDDFEFKHPLPLHKEVVRENNLLEKCIIHLDVDCFYCQAEELRNPALASKPLAIGQKHIIVTSNYIARKMGVKKLQGRREALRSCPSLIIVEGSDLEPYREASRLIYSAFRTAVRELDSKNSTKKGGMDECFADITASVQNSCEGNTYNADVSGSKLYASSSSAIDDDIYNVSIWIYGEDENSSTVQVTEDQSGASSISIWKNNTNRDIGERWGIKEEKRRFIHNMQIAAKIARKVQNQVKHQTGFTTTIGISSSPMLAKLASDLKKPKSCNILYPWRSEDMISNMPLRRIPDLGSKTLYSLTDVLKEYNREKDVDGMDFWTCRDLLNVPSHVIRSCLEKKSSNKKSNQSIDDSFADLLLNRCKGIDTKNIEDDGGSLPKTVSVEDSFVRGSLTCIEEVIRNLDILFVRLLRLLERRKEVSNSPQNAYPRTIRLTARIVDHSITTNRRSFRNISKQAAFSGQVMMGMKCKADQMTLLKRCTLPLLEILKELTVGLNVTRLNLATVSFADIDMEARTVKETHGRKNASRSSGKEKQSNLISFFQQPNRINAKCSINIQPADNKCNGMNPQRTSTNEKHEYRDVHTTSLQSSSQRDEAKTKPKSSVLNKFNTRKGDEGRPQSLLNRTSTSMEDVINNLKRKQSKRSKMRNG